MFGYESFPSDYSQRDFFYNIIYDFTRKFFYDAYLVISSPSNSTTGFSTLIFCAIVKEDVIHCVIDTDRKNFGPF
jgi:hypothetical protein